MCFINSGVYLISVIRTTLYMANLLFFCLSCLSGGIAIFYLQVVLLHTTRKTTSIIYPMRSRLVYLASSLCVSFIFSNNNKCISRASYIHTWLVVLIPVSTNGSGTGFFFLPQDNVQSFVLC